MFRDNEITVDYLVLLQPREILVGKLVLPSCFVIPYNVSSAVALNRLLLTSMRLNVLISFSIVKIQFVRRLAFSINAFFAKHLSGRVVSLFQ